MSHAARFVLVAAALAATIACDGKISSAADPSADASTAAVSDAAATDDASTPSDATPSTDAAPAVPDAGPPDANGVDGAALVDLGFPFALGCTAAAVGVITMRNTGTTTWSAANGYALGALGDSDPLHPSGTRVPLPSDVSVAPGEDYTFGVALTAPGAAGSYQTDWRMVRNDAWFGADATRSIDVWCDAITADSFDLSAVTVVSSPDVRGFAVTSTLTGLGFSPDTFFIDHSKRGTWPPVVIADDGTEQEATIWVFFNIGGNWYATGGERLRPDQTTKQLTQPSHIGEGWLYDPGRWGIMTRYVPSPGDLVGFMVVAGSTRSDDRVIVEERTNVVLVPFPADGTSTSFPPFAWQE